MFWTQSLTVWTVIAESIWFKLMIECQCESSIGDTVCFCTDLEVYFIDKNELCDGLVVWSYIFFVYLVVVSIFGWLWEKDTMVLGLVWDTQDKDMDCREMNNGDLLFGKFRESKSPLIRWAEFFCAQWLQVCNSSGLFNRDYQFLSDA